MMSPGLESSLATCGSARGTPGGEQLRVPGRVPVSVRSSTLILSPCSVTLQIRRSERGDFILTCQSRCGMNLGPCLKKESSVVRACCRQTRSTTRFSLQISRAGLTPFRNTSCFEPSLLEALSGTAESGHSVLLLWFRPSVRGQSLVDSVVASWCQP